MLSNKEERENIFKKVLELNAFLTQKDIISITRKPERTVAYWFSGERVIDGFSLSLIKQALSLSCHVIPRELNRYLGRFYNYPKTWALNNHSGNKEPEYKGKLVGRGNTAKKKYTFNDQELSVKDISLKLKITTNKIYSVIYRNNIKEKSDITEILNNSI